MSLPTLVLSAGLGTRLDPLTRLLAKPAVPLGDRTLIEHVLAWLRRHGVHDVVVNLHHRPATVTAVLGDGAHLGLSVRYSWEQPLLGSAGGPRRALPLLAADHFLIVNGDTLSDLDLDRMIDAHRHSGADVTMALIPNTAPDRYNGVMLEGDVVTGFVPRGDADGSWHFVGVQLVRSSVFAHLPDDVPLETVAGIYREIVANSPGRIRGWRAASRFLDVGTPRDYLQAAQLERTARGASRLKTVVWPGAMVSSAASLDECVVIGDVHVPAGFSARRAVLAPSSILEPTDRVEVQSGIAIFPL